MQDFDIWAKAHNRKLSEKAKKSIEQAGVPVERGLSIAIDTCPANATKPCEPVPPDKKNQAFVEAQISTSPASRLTLAGLLSVLDEVDEQKGLLFILTTSKVPSMSN